MKNIQEAAKSLEQELCQKPWFSSVEVVDYDGLMPDLVIYVTEEPCGIDTILEHDPIRIVPTYKGIRVRVVIRTNVLATADDC